MVVDDNPHTLRIVELALSKAGYEVLLAESGQEALQLLERRGLPHVALVDLNMPRMGGDEFCRVVHRFSDLPIIILTAVNEEKTIVHCMEAFAEDYIVKPFNPQELVARVRRLLLRIGDYAYTLDPMMHVDSRLQVNFARRQAVIDGEEVSLTPTETKLLHVLMRNAGRVVTSDFIMRRLWPLEYAYEDRLHVYIHRLRSKIESTPAEPHYIVSERGTGYRFPIASN